MVLHGLHYNLQLGLRGAATGLKSFHVSQSKIMKLLTLSLKVTLSHHFNMLEGGEKKVAFFGSLQTRTDTWLRVTGLCDITVGRTNVRE